MVDMRLPKTALIIGVGIHAVLAARIAWNIKTRAAATRTIPFLALP
jgi:hypothetical protein